MPNDQPVNVVPEAEQISRAVRTWLNSYPDKPMRVVDVEFLGETSGLALETIQAAYRTRRYITGGYQAQYQFGILYQTIATTANERLEADEILNEYATWAEATSPELPEGCRFIRVERNTNAAILSRDANGSEIHQILLTLLYEVNV